MLSRVWVGAEQVVRHFVGDAGVIDDLYDRGVSRGDDLGTFDACC